MKEFASIEDFVLPGAERVRILDPETEQKINEELEELHRIRLINEFNAIEEAKKIIIF